MKRGFELLKTLKPGECKYNLHSVEDSFGFALPPLYKLFISTFKTGQDDLFVDILYRERYFDPLLKKSFPFNSPIYEPLKDNNEWSISITCIYSIDDIFKDWNEFLKYESEWLESKFIRISDIGHGGGLFLGTEGENKDTIHIVIWDNEPISIKIADNIFEFIQGLVLHDLPNEKENFGIEERYNTSMLYKNYGEEIWRVKE